MAGFISSLFGSKAHVPYLQQLDLGTEQGKAISSNQANLPAAENLVSQANIFSTNQINQMLQSVIPGYSGIVSGASGNIQSMLKGEVPTDVAQQIQNSAAARAIGGGYGGSGAHANLVARDLGLTSLDLTQKGISSAQSWISSMASHYEPSMMNVKDMFITPAQQAIVGYGLAGRIGTVMATQRCVGK